MRPIRQFAETTRDVLTLAVKAELRVLLSNLSLLDWRVDKRVGVH